MVPLCRCKGCSICVRFFGPVRRAFRSCAAEDVASLTGRNDRPFGAGRGRMRALFPGAGRPFDPMIPARTIAAGLGGRSAGGRRDASARRRTAGARAAGGLPGGVPRAAFSCLFGGGRGGGGGPPGAGAARRAPRRLGLSRRSSACGALSGGAERDVRRFSRLRVYRAGRILRCTPCEEDGPRPPEDRVGSAPRSRPTESGGDRAGRRNRRIIRPDESR